MNTERQGGAGFAPTRPFGARLDDLETDFAAPRPYVITDVLERCSSGAGADEIWDQPAGRRIAGLLELAALGGVDSFDSDFACPECGLAVEVTLEIEELLNAARSSPQGPVEVSVEAGEGVDGGQRFG